MTSTSPRFSAAAGAGAEREMSRVDGVGDRMMLTSQSGGGNKSGDENGG